jgi:hypothetical protein
MALSGRDRSGPERIGLVYRIAGEWQRKEVRSSAWRRSERIGLLDRLGLDRNGKRGAMSGMEGIGLVYWNGM